MNAKRFKVIFSKRKNALVVVGENASSVTKAAGTSDATSKRKVALQSFVGVLSSIFLAVHSAYADLPTGAQWVSGSGSYSVVGNDATIKNDAMRSIVNFQTFNSGVGQSIHIDQNANAALLAKVVGGLPSELNGSLTGAGRFYLINQNGIMLGKGGIINVNGGFIASTRDVINDAFMKGGALVFKGESVGDIQILGKVKSERGDIVLIAQKVDVKQGATLVAGEKVQLIAANEVQLTDGKITVKPSTNDAGQITVEGAVQAAQVQLLSHNNNLGALAINTSGTIRATGTQTNPDGSVSIIATGNGSNINISGNIRSEKNDGNGGAVTVLADNAIRVSGTIDANSTDATKTGGDIIIGRDIVTGKLAKATNVSGATLLSNKGFVETSAHLLAVDDIKINAGTWLLDPDNIEITNNATPSIAGYSIINASTIATALINTNVVINTTGSETGVGDNPAAGGDGNILVSSAITKTGATATKLTLNADNGITVNQKISSTGGALDVEMTALGIASSAATSDGINIYANIETKGGNIKLTGTTSQDGNEGVYIHGGTTLNANNIEITGTATGGFISGSKEHAKGIRSFGTLTATDKITLTGTSTNVTGVGIEGGSLTAGGAVVIKGITTNGIYQGANIGGSVTGSSVEITGNSRDHLGVAIGVGKTIKATVGDVTITGTSIKSDGISVGPTAGGAFIQAAKNVNLIGEGLYGVRVWDASSITSDGNINITGTSNTSAVQTGYGVLFQRYAKTATLNATGDINIEGTLNGSGKGSGVGFLQSGWGAQAPMITAGGTFKLRGNNRASASNTYAALDAPSGMQVKAKNIVVQAETNNAAVVAMNFFSQPYGANPQPWGNALYGNTSFVATENVLIQANQGGIAFNNTITPTLTSGILTAITDIKGKNITIDNTGAGMAIGAGTAVTGSGGTQGASIANGGIYDATTGAVVAGSGFASGATTGININDGRKLTATGNVNISGASQTGNGVYLNANINNDSTDGGVTNIKANKGTIYLAGTSKITNASAAGAINIVAGDGNANSTAAIVSEASATITQNSNAGVTMSTDGTGHLTVAKIINNGSGDVILAAGKKLAAGDGTGGQIKTVVGNNVGGTGSGKLYVYTGSAAGTGLLQNLTGGNNTAFSTLSLSSYTADNSSTVQQNAAANVAYSTGASRNVISTSTANAQVMFREKVAIDSITLNGYALNLIYGDLVSGVDVTHSGQTAALLSQMQSGLKQSNPGTTVATSTLTQSGTSNAGTFRISKAAVIDDMTGSLTSTAYSTSQHLTATTHNYGALTGTNYTTTLAANKAQVMIAKAALTISGITASDKVYNGDAAASVVTAGLVKGGLVGSDAVTVSSTGNFRNAGNTAEDKNVARDGSGNVITKTVALSNTYGGADAGNYTITDQATTTAKITPKPVTISAAGNTVIFNSQQQTDGVTKEGFLTGDNVGNVVGAGTGTQAGTYQSNLRLTGDTSDISNYNVSFKNAVFTINAQTYVRPPVETTILSPVTFGLAFAGGASAAGGDGVDISASCDAWSQRSGTGSVAVMTLLKSSFMGLRNAKTDTMDAMSGGSATASAGEAGDSPCGSAGLVNKQAGL